MKMLAAPSSCKVAPIVSAGETGVGSRLPGWKRALDIACALAALPLLVVGVLIMTLLTSVTSPGPVFFRQERVGFQGRRFKLFKFRTMHVSADVSAHQLHFAQLVRSNLPMRKLDGHGDKRLIAGGRFLRASGLDELPQILNVLRGEMSIVGPRPCIPYEFAEYSALQRQRCNVAPGLTGLWQVSGKNRTTFDEMIQWDLTYARTLSLGLDLKIIVRTVPALLDQLQEARRRRRDVGSIAR